jgi:hypothetical protein
LNSEQRKKKVKGERIKSVFEGNRDILYASCQV